MAYTQGTAKQFLIAAVNINKKLALIIGDYILNYLDKAARRCRLGVVADYKAQNAIW